MTRDELYWLTVTVLQEAGGEPYLGKLAVACVIVTRARHDGTSISDTVLKPLIFSAWNTSSPTRRMLDKPEDDQWVACYKAACAAYFDLVPDPTFRADHYLAEKSLPKLPAWFAESKVTVRIGNHTFLRLW